MIKVHFRWEENFLFHGTTKTGDYSSTSQNKKPVHKKQLLEKYILVDHYIVVHASIKKKGKSPVHKASYITVRRRDALQGM